MKNSPQNIRGYTDTFYSVTLRAPHSVLLRTGTRTSCYCYLRPAHGSCIMHFRRPCIRMPRSAYQIGVRQHDIHVKWIIICRGRFFGEPDANSSSTVVPAVKYPIKFFNTHRYFCLIWLCQSSAVFISIIHTTFLPSVLLSVIANSLNTHQSIARWNDKPPPMAVRQRILMMQPLMLLSGQQVTSGGRTAMLTSKFDLYNHGFTIRVL